MKNTTQLSSIEIFFTRESQKLPKPYSSLERILPPLVNSMYLNAKPMKALLNELNAKVVVEVGSWLGASSTHIASCLPSDGIIYCVDHWKGSAEHQIFWKGFLSTLYQQFLSNIIHLELTKKVIPLRMSSLEGAKLLSERCVKPDVIYIDASHDEESVYNDLVAYYSLIENQGVLCGDDWGWGEELDLPVQKAVKRFAELHNFRIDLKNNSKEEPWFWVLRKGREI